MFMKPQVAYDIWFVGEETVVPLEYPDFEPVYGEDRVSVGWCARLSAPGYLDRTDWIGPFEDALSAYFELSDMYRVFEDESPEEAAYWEELGNWCREQDRA